MTEENYWINAIANPLKRAGRILGIAALAAILPGVLAYVFCFSIKSAPEYRCALGVLADSGQVASIAGSPLTPGLIAWTRFYESGGMLTQGAFTTHVSGPDGGGSVEVNFYRAPVGATLGVWFTSNGEEIVVYDGEYPCDE
jgi:hypothetical protein